MSPVVQKGALCYNKNSAEGYVLPKFTKSVNREIQAEVKYCWVVIPKCKLIPSIIHYENMPIQIYWKFYHQKNENFQIKNSDIFLFLLKT